MRKRLNLYKEAKNISESLKLLNWLASPKAESFYPPSIIPSKISIWQEQFDLLSPIETAQISKDIEVGRMRLNSADSIDRLIERCHVQNYSLDLTEIIRNLCSVKPDKFIEILSNRLIKIVLSDFCPNEQIRQEYSQELLELSSTYDNPTIKCVKYNLNQEGNSPDIGTLIIGPRNVLDTLKSEKDQEKVLKLVDELKIVTKKWTRAFNNQVQQKHCVDPIASKLKLKALIGLNYFDDALQLIPTFSNDDLLDDLLFEPVLTVLEASRELSRVISLIESKLMQIDPENPQLILRLVDNLITAQRFTEASEYLQAIPAAYQKLDDNTEARLVFATGLCAWHTGNQSKSTLAHFLNSAKMNPHESKHFEWIGKFYWRIEKESERALKCLTKALNLDPLNLNAAILFSEVVLEIKNDPDVISQLLKPFTKISSQSRNRRLFYYHAIALFNSKNYLDSSVSFQSALKGSLIFYHEDATDPPISDENCLQWLGEAYLRSNRLGSAVKTFTRLANISAGKSEAIGSASVARETSYAFITAQVGLAAVHLKSNNPIDAVDCLNEIKLNEPKVNLEKSKSFLALARFYLRQGRFISAMQALLNSIKIAPIGTAEGLRNASEVLCLAHKYREMTGFPAEEFGEIEFGDLKIKINSGLQEICNSLKDGDSLAGKGVKLALAGISEAFKDPRNHSLSSFWLQVAINLSATDFYDDEIIQDFIISAASNAVKEIDSSPVMKSQGHQIQAQMYTKTPKTHQLAQHHFISALKHFESSQLWTDLGRFYLKAGDWQLASDSFKKALTADQEDLVAAFELARSSGTIEGNADALQVAQRAFTQQPVHFTEDFAERLLKSESDCGILSKYAAVYLKRLHPQENYPGLQQIISDIPSFPIPTPKKEILNYLNNSETPEIWLSSIATGFDCEFLLKRPENEVTQSGWRAVVEGLLPISKERSKLELEELN